MITRLAKYIVYKDISVRSFEMTIGASDGMIRRAIKNFTDIQCKWLTEIADNYHDISIDWLVTGKGQMIKSGDDIQLPTTKIVYQSDPRDADLIASNRETIETQRKLIASLEDKIADLEKLSYPTKPTRNTTGLRSVPVADSSYLNQSGVKPK